MSNSNSSTMDAGAPPDDFIPEVSPETCLEWCDRQIKLGKQAIAKMVTQAEAEERGDLVPGAYDPKAMAGLKEAAGLLICARKALIGLVGSAAGVPADDIDEVFLGIVSGFHQVPKVGAE